MQTQPVATGTRAPGWRRARSLVQACLVAGLLSHLALRQPRAQSGERSAATVVKSAAAPPPAFLFTSSDEESDASDPTQEEERAVPKGPWRASAIGSGSWGNTVALLMAENTATRREWVQQVTMNIYDEIVVTESDMYGLNKHREENADKGVVTLPADQFGTKLSHIINTQHENIKYLPGVKLPKNLKAEPDMEASVTGADVVVLGVPDQFVSATCRKMKPFLKPSARVIVLAKGVEFEHGTLLPVTEIVAKELGLPAAQVCCLMGANIAKDVAFRQFSETTLGCRTKEDLKWLKPLFARPYFPVATVRNVEGPQMCGALKNIVAIGKGLLDGLGMGTNTIAALMRIGMNEMKGFILEFFDVPDLVFWESCCFADLITTCMSGRNQLVGAEYARRGGASSFQELERELLNGQSLQGTITSVPVHQIITKRGWKQKYPLLEGVYQVVAGKAQPRHIMEVLESVPQMDGSV